jgi:hypothetical protein
MVVKNLPLIPAFSHREKEFNYRRTKEQVQTRVIFAILLTP